MSNDNEFGAESRPVVLSDDRQQEVDEWGRRAGAALRSSAPENGVSAIRRRVRNHRIGRAGALAGVVAVIAIGVAVLGRGDNSTRLRPGDDIPNDTVLVNDLHDVNQQEAFSLAQRALISEPDDGHGWQDTQDYESTHRPGEAAATIAALPECALLTSVGLFPPTTKSATAYQFVIALGLFGHRVLVFATPQDASRAMDVIAGKLYPTCSFNASDRGYAPNSAVAISEAWEAPQIALHGDRQVIIGQHTTTINAGFREQRYLVNAYVQVGRAITWINPDFVATEANPLLEVENEITAATTALTKVFGP